MRLTRTQRKYLSAITDWTAAWEVLQRQERSYTFKARANVEVYLNELVEAGLAEFGKPNRTYRITDAGRAALGLLPENSHE